MLVSPGARSEGEALLGRPRVEAKVERRICELRAKGAGQTQDRPHRSVSASVRCSAWLPRLPNPIAAPSASYALRRRARFTYASSAAFTRVCHPCPSARKNSTTSGSSRMFTLHLVHCAWRPPPAVAPPMTSRKGRMRAKSSAVSLRVSSSAWNAALMRVSQQACELESALSCPVLRFISIDLRVGGTTQTDGTYGFFPGIGRLTIKYGEHNGVESAPLRSDADPALLAIVLAVVRFHPASDSQSSSAANPSDRPCFFRFRLSLAASNSTSIPIIVPTIIEPVKRASYDHRHSDHPTGDRNCSHTLAPPRCRSGNARGSTRHCKATQDPSEAGRLYDALLNLPCTAPTPDPVDPEFAAWCVTGRLPEGVAGLRDVSTIVGVVSTMSTTAQIIRAAQRAIEFHQPVAARSGRAGSELLTTPHGTKRIGGARPVSCPTAFAALELLAIDIKLEEEI